MVAPPDSGKRGAGTGPTRPAAGIAVGRAGRLRGRARWAFVLAGILLAAALVGALQLVLGGAMSIRPGRPPVGGAEAITQLALLTLEAAALLLLGGWLRRRARRPG